jgi:hypothetical protein
MVRFRMASRVLYAGCPVCGQNLRSWAWIEGIEQRPISIAHEARIGRTIVRRELALGEGCSPDALEIAGEDDRGKAVYVPARGKCVPDWWPDMLKRQLFRTARTLGYTIAEEDDRLDRLRNQNLTERQFQEIANDYISEAAAELDFRKRSVAKATTKR